MSQSESDQPNSEGVAQNQENILQNIQADNVYFAPSQNITNIIQERDETLYEFKPACPYKGLKRFNADDKDKFFGRDALIQRFLDAINSSPLSLILGASGSGKSSLVSAGIIPKLKDSLVGVNFSDFIVRLGEDPFASLYNCFLSHDKDYHESDVDFLRENSAKTLPRAIKQLKKPDQYWLFFIDQFEQLFTNPNNKVCDNFIDGLVKVANLRDSSVKIVLAMRADFLEYLSGYPALGKILNQNNIHLVTDMHPDELRQVIKEPARKHGVGFQEGLVEQIIKDVEGQKGSLPLLQYTLELLWKTECELIAADGRPHIADRTLNTFNYNALEGVRGALQKRINEIYEEQNKEEKLTTKQIFLKLVRIVETDSGSRVVSQVVSYSQFVGTSKEKVLEDLTKANLLVKGSKYVTKEDVVININTKRKQVATVELAHEILLSSWDALRRWLEEEKQNIILRNRLADDALDWHSMRQQNKSQAKHELLKGSKLDDILACRKADGFSNLDELSPIENEYIDASVAQRQKEIRQAQLFFIIAGVAVILMSGVTGFAIKQQKEAVLASVEAMKNNADLLIETGQTFEAWIEILKGGSKLKENNLLGNIDSHDTSIALAITMQNAMNNTYVKNKTLTDYSDAVNSVSFSPDGETIASASSDKTVKLKLWNLQGKLLNTFTIHDDPVEYVSISFRPDSQTIVSAGFYYNGVTLQLWNLQGKLLNTFTIHDDPVEYVSFSPDGKTIASTSWDTVKLWNLQGKLIHTLTSHDDYINSVSFSPDGKTIASASKDKTVKLWNLQGKLLSTLTGHSDSVNSVSFSPDGKTIASLSYNGTVKLWNLKGKLLNTFTSHARVNIVSFSPDGKTITSLSYDGTVKLWNLDLKDLQEKSCKYLHDYLVNHPDTLIELTLCQNKSIKKEASFLLITQGMYLARENDMKNAIEKLNQAKQWNPDFKFVTMDELRPIEESQKLIKVGVELAKKLDIEGATATFKKAIEFDPKVILEPSDPKDKALQIAESVANLLIGEGQELAKQGNIQKAINNYQQAETVIKINAYYWNKLCLLGSLTGPAKEVLFTCDKAVVLEPKDYFIFRTRGIARAINGNIQGAIKDFEFYIKNTKYNQQYQSEAQQWVKDLKAGKNPFTPELRKKLLYQLAGP